MRGAASAPRRVGPGFALAAFVLSGAFGNLANAVYYRAAHDSIGASTSVFGLVGFLAGLEAWRRSRLDLPWRGAWVALGGAVGLLAMLGAGGPKVDFGAHLFGLLAGGILGIPIGFALPRPPRPLVQWILGGTAVMAVLYCWGLALD